MTELLVTLISVTNDWMVNMSEQTTRQISIQPLSETADEVADLARELIGYCSQLDLDLDLSDAELCVRHLLMVNQVNQYMNLTRISDIHEALVLHVVDSLSLTRDLPIESERFLDMGTGAGFPGIPFAIYTGCEGVLLLVLHVVDSLSLTRDLPIESERFLDMGTGAGFPGIPFAIYTGCEGVLLDSVGKKINAVDAFIADLGLDTVSAVHDRCESYASKHASEFDIVFARAVGQMNLIVEYATPFIEEDGYLVMAKANPSDEERRIADKTAELCGLELVGVDEFDLPCELGHRTVYLYQKVSKPRVKLPRAVGLAKKQPLVM